LEKADVAVVLGEESEGISIFFKVSGGEALIRIIESGEMILSLYDL